MRKHAPERDLQKAVVKYLEAREKAVGDITFLHIPNAGKRTANHNYALARQGMRPGAPDLIVWANLRGSTPRAVTYQIELKSMTGRQSAAQKEFEARLTHIYHNYHLVKVKTEAEAVAAVGAIIDG